MSRSEPDNSEKYYIGKHKPEVQYSVSEPMHWYEAYTLGYRAKAWPKRNDDCDDDRYNLKEKENYNEPKQP